MPPVRPPQRGAHDDGQPCAGAPGQDARLREDLTERVKELSCLVEVNRAAQRLEDPEALARRTAAALVPAMCAGDRAVARVRLPGADVRTGPLAADAPQIRVPVTVGGRRRGEVRVGYPDATVPFLPEERELARAVSATLALWVERTESSAALQESEARFRKLFDNVRDVVYRYRLGPAGGFEFVSPSIEAVTGRTVDDHLGDPTLVRRLVHPADRRKLDRVLAGEVPTRPALLRFVGADGRVRWTEHRLVAVRDARGDTTAIEGVARDVTNRIEALDESQRRAAEQAALAALGELALSAHDVPTLLDAGAALVMEALDAAAAAVWELDDGGAALLRRGGAGLREDTPASRRLPATETSMAWRALAQDGPLVVRDVSEDPSLCAPFLSEQGVVSAVTVVIGGRERAFGVLAAYSRRRRIWSPEQVRFVQTAAHMLAEVVDRQRAEAEVVRREEEFRSLAEHSPDIVSRFDRELRHVYVNPVAARVTGLPVEAFLGRTNRELGMPEHLVDRWDAVTRRVLTSGEPTSVEFSYERPDGKVVHLHSRLIPEHDPQGAVATVLSVTRDITDLREAEEERRAALSRAVAAQERERARIAEDIHDDPVQVMVAVGMRIEALRIGLQDSTGSEALDTLADVVRSAIHRLRSLMFELRPPELDREGLAAALHRYLSTTLAEDGPAWEVMDRCTAPLDGEQRVVLYRIAQEAVANVRKHARAAHLVVELADDGGGVRLELRDDGVGLDEAEVAGRGPHHVGLAMMRERAESCDGSLVVARTPGGGTTLRAWLPRSRRVVEVAVEPPAPEPVR
jgi:PAS domain S-box-containing protein